MLTFQLPVSLSLCLHLSLSVSNCCTGSRTGDPNGLKICVPGVPLDEDMLTKNVVYRKVLLHDYNKEL
jgi:hypothetical protein